MLYDLLLQPLFTEVLFVCLQPCHREVHSLEWETHPLLIAQVNTLGDRIVVPDIALPKTHFSHSTSPHYQVPCKLQSMTLDIPAPPPVFTIFSTQYSNAARPGWQFMFKFALRHEYIYKIIYVNFNPINFVKRM